MMRMSGGKYKYLSICLTFITMIVSSCCYDDTREFIYYRGMLVVGEGDLPIDTTIAIYSSNLSYMLLDSDGNIRNDLGPTHPDTIVSGKSNFRNPLEDTLRLGTLGERISEIIYDKPYNGNFCILGLTYNHCINEKVEHWQCGPLRIYIQGENVNIYYDSLTNEQLKLLEQNEAGEWILPKITLQKK